MSKIDKLSILGVRSFDNARSEVIQFHTPLTLIVGYNGSGKTTIIECLKYATTGELPPNSKGGAFIHDPKLCGEKEVMAQVKLSFKSTSGARMVATRNLQLTVKKTTRSQKTLEGQLMMQKDGERTAISSRVAELDQILPQYLGASKAILESVIFCHQDESLWPMSEPAALKKKFDEIFEALKYTKAIDNIKALRKKQNEKLVNFKIMENHAKEDKDKADKAEKKSRELSDEIETLRQERQELREQAKDAGTKAQEAWNQVARYTEVVESLKVARKNQEWYHKQLNDLRQDLKERSEPDDILESELARHEERMGIQEERQHEQTRNYESIRNEVALSRNRQSDKRTEAGKHEQQRATYEQRIKDREQEIKRSAREHNIRGFDSELDDMQITEFMDRIAKLSKDQTAKVDRLRRENLAEAQKVQAVLDGLRERRSTLQEGKKSAKEQTKINDRKIATHYTELESIVMDEAGKAGVEANIEELAVKLQKAKELISGKDIEARIQESNRKLQLYEEESATLNRELIQATKQAGDLARLDHLKKESKDRQRSLDTMLGAYGERLGELLGHEPQLSSLETEFQAKVESKTNHIVNAERQRDGVSRELEQVEYKLKTARTDLTKKQKEVEQCITNIQEKTMGNPEDYPENLAGAQADRDIRKSDVEGFMNMKKYFNQCIQIAKSEEPACRLCARPFHDDKSIGQFVAKLEKAVSSKALEEMQSQLDALEAELQATKEAGTSYDTWVRLTEREIPSLKADVGKFEQQRDSTLLQIEQHDIKVTSLGEARRDVEELSKPVSTIVKCKAEMKAFRDQIDGLAGKQEGANQTRTLEDIQERIESIGSQARDQRQAIVKLQAEEQGNRETVSSLELGLGNARNKLTTATHELEKRASVQSQIHELKKSNQEQRTSVSELDAELSELGPRFSEEQAKLDDIRERADRKEKEGQREATDLMESFRGLQRADNEVRAYLEQGGPAKLEKCQQDIEYIEQQITLLEAQAKQVIIEINKIREELGNQDQNKRVINDNLKYRRASRELQAVEVEIERLSAQNAEADQQRHRRDAESFQREHQEALAKETSKMGTMKAKDDQLMDLLKDWNTDYKDAAAKYKKSHIEVETTKAAVEDLGRYAGALDKAIMKYHSLKMEEINRIVEELWKRTYQGTDVDTILIRSDNENAKGNRSYNYRVCMVKQDAEMDMRGRCSAGQKVLASIIIRLALAECFGVNCGLVALDEPTTNLDRDNIRSLAESLHDIIRARQQQANFQLIVITHDEEFLRYMKCADFCDNYYRVSRNARQKSIIERQSIAEVM